VTRAAAAAAALVILAAGWTAYVHLWRHGDSRPLTYRDESAKLRGFRTLHPLAHVFRSRNPGETSVLVASGPRSSSAYRIEVVNVTEERGRVVVRVREHTPTLANPGRARLTYPYRLLVLPRLDKHITVKWEGRP
jgi:protease stability complex PrcB-like protein